MFKECFTIRIGCRYGDQKGSINVDLKGPKPTRAETIQHVSPKVNDVHNKITIFSWPFFSFKD